MESEVVSPKGFHFDEATHIYRLGGRILPGSGEILKDAGFKYPQGNMEMGRAVHMATQFDDEGTLDTQSVTDEVYGFVLAWRLFRKETGFVPNRIEQPNVNSSLMYATVLDREGTWNLGKPHVLVEIKKYPPTYFTGLQLASQDMTLPELTLPRDRVVAQLNADGSYKLHWFKDPNDRAMWMFLVSLYWFKRNNGA